MGIRVKLLLDTCVFIWLVQKPDCISDKAKRAIDDLQNELLFSHASIWEIHLKSTAGKLRLPEAPRLWISQQLKLRGVVALPIDLESLHRTAELPLLHKDPFDRLLIAQALTHELTLLTPDPLIQKYAVKTLW